MKLTLIGGGGVRSPLFVMTLLRWQKRIGVTELCLMDIDERKLALFSALCRELVGRAGNPFTLTATADDHTRADIVDRLQLQAGKRRGHPAILDGRADPQQNRAAIRRLRNGGVGRHPHDAVRIAHHMIVHVEGGIPHGLRESEKSRHGWDQQEGVGNDGHDLVPCLRLRVAGVGL